MKEGGFINKLQRLCWNSFTEQPYNNRHWRDQWWSRCCKAVANGPVGQVLAGPLFLKVKTKFHFTKSK